MVFLSTFFPNPTKLVPFPTPHLLFSPLRKQANKAESPKKKENKERVKTYKQTNRKMKQRT